MMTLARGKALNNTETGHFGLTSWFPAIHQNLLPWAASGVRLKRENLSTQQPNSHNWTTPDWLVPWIRLGEHSLTQAGLTIDAYSQWAWELRCDVSVMVLLHLGLVKNISKCRWTYIFNMTMYHQKWVYKKLFICYSNTNNW